jgi:multidrug efflux pump subunit AcrA (membrane-fusion protein)
MTKKLVLALVLGGVIATGFALSAPATDDASEPPSAVVARGTFEDFLPVRGDIRPSRSIVLTAPSSGGDLQIVELARNGASVAAGDVVVAFDATSQQRTREQKESELKQADAELERVRAEGQRLVRAAEADLAHLRSLAERARLDLAKTEMSSRVEGDKLKLALADAELHVRAQEQKLAAERARVAADATMAQQKRDKASADVAETVRIIETLTMRAPAAGVVSLLSNFRAGGPFNRSPPEFKRGDRAWFGASIAELPDLGTVHMTCRIDEADRARVRPKTRARVRVDALPDREISAIVREISLVAKPDFSAWPPVRNFDVLIALDETDPRLRSGMSASARLELERLTDVIVVPSAAVFSREGGTLVYVLDRGRPVARPVSVARRGQDQTAITSGLNEGERVTLQEPASAAPR